MGEVARKRKSRKSYERPKRYRFVVARDSDSEDEKTGSSEDHIESSTYQRNSPENEAPLEKEDVLSEFDDWGSTKSEGEESDEGGSSDSEDSDCDSDSWYSFDSQVSDSDSDFYEEEEKFETALYTNPIEDLKGGLKLWSLRNNISLKARSELLLLLKNWFTRFNSILNIGKWLDSFPKDARTLMKTNTANYDIRPVLSQHNTPGEFVYIGLEKNLKRQVKEVYFPDHKIELSVGADGFPLFRSSSTGFWV